MIIDTKEEASTLWRTKTFAVIVFVVAVLVIIFVVSIDSNLKTALLGGLSLIFLAFYWFQYKMEYTYFYFSSNNNNLVFKFYSLRNLYGKPKVIEISKLSFLKYDIESVFFGKKDLLVLYRKTPKGVAKYPPISLTLLSKKQKTELKRTLYAASAEK
ncbi:MAG: hypothetical protein LBR08_09765 [Bacteroidales bacterium]|jgi:hypothetical protein|nr:hypothetical protein [Bacteroidales bacterium]